MSEDEATDGTSVAAQHRTLLLRSFPVAPTEETSRFNTVRIPLVPVACWRLGDPAFDFDSSFVLPIFRGELARLAALVQTNAGCPAAIFAHADPVGSDAVNKTVSDRRGIAIYALLTRQPSIWEDLYVSPEDGDSWGIRAIQAMLQTVVGRAADDDGNALPPGSAYYAGAADGKNGHATKAAVKAFQADSGLTADGDAGPATRKVLFGAYMDVLCTPQSAAPAEDGDSANPDAAPPSAPAPFRMKVTDFLGGASAAAGDLPKMSLQGCSRFNPVVLLTTDEMSGSDKTTRNSDDAANRRVLLFFFPKDTNLDASAWPCPRVKESSDGCKAVFWSDGEKRRQNGDTRRDYKTDRRTMACRFYDRFARRSPCEIGLPTSVKLRFFDTMANALAGAVYRVREVTPGGAGGFQSSGRADANAAALLRGVTPPATLEVTWGPAPSDDDDGADEDSLLFYTLLLDVLLPAPSSEERLKQQLNALGYPADAPLSECVRRFQADYGLPQNGDPNDAQTASKVDTIYSTMNPKSLTPPDSIYKSLFDVEGE